MSLITAANVKLDVMDGENISSTVPPIETSSSSTPPTTSNNNIKARRIIRRRPQNNQVSQAAITIDPQYLREVLQSSNLPIDVYSFEIERTVQRCIVLNVSHIALQMPEGLLLYATVLVDVIQKLIASVNKTKDVVKVSILSDVTYGACCIDDITASQLGCELLIHYGHSCLVPLQHTIIPVQYVFVEIQFYVPHLVQCLMMTLFPTTSSTATTQQPIEKQMHHLSISQGEAPVEERIHLYLLGTIQFRHALLDVQEQLLVQYQQYVADQQQQHGDRTVIPTLTISIPQCKPLSPGEVLGCTSPILNTHLLQPNADGDKNLSRTTTKALVCFIADGRFHLESTMISNHNKINTFYRYDPYSRLLSIEAYAFDEMKRLRYDAIQYASKYATIFGIILGTLGRQGNPAIVQKIQQTIRNAKRKCFIVLLSEITPQKLHLLSSSYNNKNKSNKNHQLCWVQVACPRLSVDWGHSLNCDDNNSSNNENMNTVQQSQSPILLNPYELFVCLEQTTWENDTYPMDYYSTNGGPWTNYHESNKNRQMD